MVSLWEFAQRASVSCWRAQLANRHIVRLEFLWYRIFRLLLSSPHLVSRNFIFSPITSIHWAHLFSVFLGFFSAVHFMLFFHHKVWKKVARSLPTLSLIVIVYPLSSGSSQCRFWMFRMRNETWLFVKINCSLCCSEKQRIGRYTTNVKKYITILQHL